MRPFIALLGAVLGLLFVLWVRRPGPVPHVATQPAATPPVAVLRGHAARAPAVERRAPTGLSPSPRTGVLAHEGPPPPVTFREVWPYGPDSEGHTDQRRNRWEELQQYIEDAHLTPEQRARFLADLAEFEDDQHAYDDEVLASGTVPTRAAEEAHRQTVEAKMSERLAYLTDAQWRLLQRRYGGGGVGWTYLPVTLASGYILARGDEPVPVPH